MLTYAATLNFYLYCDLDSNIIKSYTDTSVPIDTSGGCPLNLYCDLDPPIMKFNTDTSYIKLPEVVDLQP